MPSSFRATRCSAVVTSLCATASCAFATTTIYTNQSSFLAAVAPDSYTEAFTGGAGQAPSYFFQGAFQGGGNYSYMVDTAGGSNVYRDGTFISTFSYNNELRLIFFGGNSINAVGGNFFATNTFDQFVPGVSITLNLSDGTSTTFTPVSPNEYRGLISTAFIQSLVMAAPGPLAANTIDNLTVGVAAAVPEPRTYVLMVMGLAAVLVASCRKA